VTVAVAVAPKILVEDPCLDRAQHVVEGEPVRWGDGVGPMHSQALS